MFVNTYSANSSFAAFYVSKGCSTLNMNADRCFDKKKLPGGKHRVTNAFPQAAYIQPNGLVLLSALNDFMLFHILLYHHVRNNIYSRKAQCSQSVADV